MDVIYISKKEPKKESLSSASGTKVNVMAVLHIDKKITIDFWLERSVVKVKGLKGCEVYVTVERDKV